jgi:hypothetical protein
MLTQASKSYSVEWQNDFSDEFQTLWKKVKEICLKVRV